MKVVNILNELQHSGAETMLLDAVESLSNEGFDIEIISMEKRNGKFKKYFQEKNVLVKTVSYYNFFSLCRHLRMLINIYHLLRETKPDIIHVHPERSNFSVTLLSKLRCRNVVRTVHHIFPPEAGIKGKLIKSVRILQRFVLRNMGVVFISNSRAGFENEKGNHKNIPHILIGNWVADRWVTAQRTSDLQIESIRKKRPGTKILGTLGGDWGYKNYDLIIQALNHLPEEYVYVRGGKGTSDHLIDLAQKLNLQDRFIDLGIIDDPITFIDSIDIYCMPSSIEGFGIAGAEAAIRGVPCVFSRCEALVELAEFYNNHIEFCDISPDSIATNILKIENYDKVDIYCPKVHTKDYNINMLIGLYRGL